jgi:hypothetical protein
MQSRLKQAEKDNNAPTRTLTKRTILGIVPHVNGTKNLLSGPLLPKKRIYNINPIFHLVLVWCLSVL